jgi:single-strand DNA-binding protein
LRHAKASTVPRFQGRAARPARQQEGSSTPDAQVSFAGNLTDQPEVRYTDGGITRATFRVAVSGRRDGEASFFTVVVWRDQAEHAATSLSKGSRVVIVGRLQQRTWTAEDGSARQVVEVVEAGVVATWAGPEAFSGGLRSMSSNVGASKRRHLLSLNQAQKHRVVEPNQWRVRRLSLWPIYAQ